TRGEAEACAAEGGRAGTGGRAERAAGGRRNRLREEYAPAPAAGKSIRARRRVSRTAGREILPDVRPGGAAARGGPVQGRREAGAAPGWGCVARRPPLPLDDAQR